MKKLIILVMLLTLSLSFTYAQATVGGWGRGIFTPVLTNLTDSWMNESSSWGGAPRIGFTISGTSDNIGAQVDITFDGAVGFGDQQKIWAKPIEMLTIAIGPSCWDNTLRGNAGFVMANWLRVNGDLPNDDYIFANARGNVIVSIAPVDGLYAYASVGGILNNKQLAGMALAGPVYYGAGFDIPGIGVIRAQYIGEGLEGADMDILKGKVNAAFKLTAVEGLMADLGVFYNIDEDTIGDMANIRLYANYTMDTLVLHLVAGADVKEADDTNDLSLNVGLGVEYGLEGGLTIQGDVRYWNDGSGSDDASKLAFGAFAKFSYSNGVFGFGIEATNKDFLWSGIKAEEADFVIALPIRLEYWF